ncbi:alpha-1,4-glucan--maltose-1-phosphate maltosyltransferase [Streptomyces sp. URMC 129]|uniref:alpha-1,4-glucan--maltose-1-phosphate maltosyltransferase n=1 Tax=Streptomyces sp. URMC 129 TaxID=3423407 RepID=UPI003F1CD593
MIRRRGAAGARIGIHDVGPVVGGGDFPSKAVVGELITVGATVWREGHDAVGATVVWRGPDDTKARTARMTSAGVGTDRWTAPIVPDAEGVWTFRVDAWGDPWLTWRHAVLAKTEAGQDADELANDLESGARLLHRIARAVRGDDARTLLAEAAADLRDAGRPLAVRVCRALSEPVHRLATEHPVRELLTKGRTHRIWVERRRALTGAWYEFFPRSTGGRHADGTPVHGTLRTAAAELDRIAAMGFDVVYLPPVHPIGGTHRKGRNNALTAAPDDVGCPWAIGSAEGGHDAVHPALGTLDDFDAFVARAAELGLEVALDLALQCSPDHPWVKEHPEWFTTRPDGSIAYAENPPKKYQDIYPLDFDNDPAGLFGEVLRVVRHWIDHGVRIFRVDNPHTKPPNLWAWLIETVKKENPEVLFLAEAFTRPARLYGLARLGFSQSYTYFTWRTSKQELTEFGTELVAHADEARPNLFVNTPDILHASLQHGGKGMFALRAALAATLSPTWGVYAGYELFEHRAAREGSEEYLDSEKYELRPRDYAAALAAGESLEPWLTMLNAIRARRPALRQLRTLRFHGIDNDALIAYSKQDPVTGDTVVVVVTLDPHHAQQGTLRLDLPALGHPWDASLTARDEVTGQTWQWGETAFVRLDPAHAVCHIVRLDPPPVRPGGEA